MLIGLTNIAALAPIRRMFSAVPLKSKKCLI
jgi:hypothetical protein